MTDHLWQAGWWVVGAVNYFLAAFGIVASIYAWYSWQSWDVIVLSHVLFVGSAVMCWRWHEQSREGG